jgi:predicted DNA-binding protein
VGALNVRIDAATASFLEKLARQRGRSKSDLVREALEALRERGPLETTPRPAELMADFIGCWDSGGLNLSERTGERFAQIVREKRARVYRLNRRRPARRVE